ncbi:MAG TPA: ATP-dependent DNA ligase [Candidatus Avipropionibacterium avicola]|uniref:DNA ligase (ATP) n=1 Tax=Candidatus Avipropionibacterium avicola TaxID=2840701 RepID=A0A9D1GZG3_9ACTN|nr:ATP-dependent DNA ligase [Candidatus Avipropionibacterium avicola]
MINPPVRPMLAAAADRIPPGMLYEPKWDGWRCLAFVDEATVQLWSRRGTEITGDFPELVAACRDQLPGRCVLDGEIVMLDGDRLEYSRLARRHGAGPMAASLARELPATFVAFDLLALDDHDCRPVPQAQRRELLEQVLADVAPPLALTPATTDLATAQHWFDVFERHGLDGVIAKPLTQPYREGSRSMVKVKHRRTADVVVGGFRWDRNASSDHPALGSLLLGAWTDEDELHFLGVTSGFPQAQRVELGRTLGDLVVEPGSVAHREHPWHRSRADRTRLPDLHGSRQRTLEQVRLIDPLLSCEVSFDALHPDPAGVRLRSNASFVRWRPDKPPEACRLDEIDHGWGEGLSGGLQHWLNEPTTMEESP